MEKVYVILNHDKVVGNFYEQQFCGIYSSIEVAMEKVRDKGIPVFLPSDDLQLLFVSFKVGGGKERYDKEFYEIRQETIDKNEYLKD